LDEYVLACLLKRITKFYRSKHDDVYRKNYHSAVVLY